MNRYVGMFIIAQHKEKNTSDLIHLAATEIAQQIKTGQISACAVVEAHIARIEATHNQLNAVVMPRFDEARREANQADAARLRGDSIGPLHGVPITVKDQFYVRGLPTTYGVARLKNNTAAADGTMVSALHQAEGNPISRPIHPSNTQ